MAQAPPHVTAASWIGTQAFNAARAQQTGMERVPATGGRKNRGSRLPVRESGSSRQESLEVASAISLAGLACPQHRIDKNGVCSSLASQTSSAKTTFNAIKARLHSTLDFFFVPPLRDQRRLQTRPPARAPRLRPPANDKVRRATVKFFLQGRRRLQQPWPSALGMPAMP